MASLVMPSSLVSLIKGKWLFSLVACTFNALHIHILLGATLTTMACTAVIRYLCVVNRTLHHWFVKLKTVAVVIVILWLLNVIVQSLPPLFSSGHGIYNSKVAYCYYFLPERDVGDTVNYTGVAGAVLLGLLIFLAYFKVFRFVSRHNRTVASNLQQGNALQREEAKIIRTLVIVDTETCVIIRTLVIVDTETWENLAADRSQWRGAVTKHLKTGEDKLTQAATERRVRRKLCVSSVQQPAYTCNTCNQDCHSRIGLHSHSRRCSSLAHN